MNKMTALQYLEARGWTTARGFWADPTANHPAQTEACEHFITPTDAALTIQRARDAEEERELFRGVMAARMSIAHRWERDGVANTEPAYMADDAARDAERAVEEYRARFAVEIVDDPENKEQP